MARAQELHDEGQYLLASEILNRLVQAEPQNQPPRTCSPISSSSSAISRKIQASVTVFSPQPTSFEPAFRKAKPPIPQPQVIRAMTTELFLNFLGIGMDSRKAEGMRFTLNLITPDNGEKFVVELENATLTNIKGFLAQASRPDAHDQPLRSGTGHEGAKRWKRR